MFKSISICLAFCVFLISGIASAEDKKPVVIAMMENAVKHYQTVGQEQAFMDFAVKDSEFYKGEFYIAAYSLLDYTNIFHAVNPKLVGKNLMKLKDTDGKLILEEMYTKANSDGSGWVDYKWPHPITKKIAQKQTFITRVGDAFLMIGYYE